MSDLERGLKRAPRFATVHLLADHRAGSETQRWPGARAPAPVGGRGRRPGPLPGAPDQLRRPRAGVGRAWDAARGPGPPTPASSTSTPTCASAAWFVRHRRGRRSSRGLATRRSGAGSSTPHQRLDREVDHEDVPHAVQGRVRGGREEGSEPKARTAKTRLSSGMLTALLTADPRPLVAVVTRRTNQWYTSVSSSSLITSAMIEATMMRHSGASACLNSSPRSSSRGSGPEPPTAGRAP